MEAEDTKKINSGGNKLFGVFLMAALVLMLLPFINTFNEFLTHVLLKWHAYEVLQEFVVPYEARVVAGMMNFFGIPAEGVKSGVWVSGSFFEIQWNCLGWQSVVLLVASFLSGFQGKFGLMSRFEVVLIGFLGTYIVNIFRLFVVGFLAISLGSSVAVFFHDYLALVFVVLWFFIFWWFSYSYVLEEKVDVDNRQ